MKSAQEAEANGNPYAALDLYEKVYSDNKDKALAAKIARLNFDLRDYEKAEKSFNRLVARDRKLEFGGRSSSSFSAGYNSIQERHSPWFRNVGEQN